MMKVHFSKFERVAGLFVLLAIAGSALSLLTVAAKKGWFSPKVKYSAVFLSADGIHPGTSVQMAGLVAGSVDEVELLNDNRIKVKLDILSKFSERIKQDSQAQLIRPFVIGERVVEISVGSAEAAHFSAGGEIPTIETVDLMTVLSGRKLGNYLETMGGMVDNLRVLAEAFLAKERTQSFIEMVDQMGPLLKNMNAMSIEVVKLTQQATKKGRLGKVLAELEVTTREINKIVPALSASAPDFGQQLASLIDNLNTLTREFKVVLPALAEVAPELPRTSQRAIEALDQAVILMKAMQKSFLIRGNVEDVKEEEARQPASK